jgi:PAS domain S-box-containing protein/TyrR family helix-turn-helix protein
MAWLGVAFTGLIIFWAGENMLVGQVLTTDFPRVLTGQSLGECLGVMAAHGSGGVIVVGGGGELLGTIGIPAILEALLDQRGVDQPLDPFIQASPQVCNIDDDIELVAQDSAMIIPVVDQGKVIGVVQQSRVLVQLLANYKNISEELRSVRILKEETDALLEVSHDYIFVTDGQGKVLRLNSAYTRITGLKAAELVGRSIYDLVKEGYYDRSPTIEVINTRQPITFTMKVKTGKTVLVTGNPLFNEKGELIRVITNGRDITELNRLKQEAEQAQSLAFHYKRELERANGTGEFIIESTKMQDIMDLIKHLSNVDSIVLIEGETGVGKEIIAREVYANSRRKDKPYIRVNCGALPDTLLESELFGYEPGAFTGASKKGKIGFFELANGGTLLLDEISEVPLYLQVKLLRVIQENEINRIGGTNPVKIDVRLIVATNRDLWEMVNENTFRKDLFYRLNIVSIRVPALRERREEIPALVTFFIDLFNRKYGLQKRVHPWVMDALITYDWPGNVRELSNAIERAVVTSPEDTISEVRLDGGDHQDEGVSAQSPINLKDRVEAYEKRLITSYLSKYRSTRKTAAALGISQTTICRKAAQYGVSLHVDHH